MAVPAQLRRLHIAVFPGLTADVAKDDGHFYAYLTQLLNGDLSSVVKFDRVMRKERKPEKSFWIRSAKVITAYLGRPLGPAHIVDDLEALRSDAALPFESRQVAHFLMRLHFAQPETMKGESLNDPQGDEAAGEVMPVVSSPETPVDVGADLAEWQRGTAALAALAVQATEPDPELAQQIVAEAQSLLALAEAYRERSALRLRITEHLGALRSRLDSCLSLDELALLSIPHPLPAAIDISRLEALVEACEESTRALAASDRLSQELKEALAEANDADDFEGAERLVQQRRDANTARNQLLAARQATIEELWRVLETSPLAHSSEADMAEALPATAGPAPAEVEPVMQPAEIASEDDASEPEGAAAPMEEPQPTLTTQEEPEPEAMAVAPVVAATATKDDEPEPLPEASPEPACETFEAQGDDVAESTALPDMGEEGSETGSWSANRDIGDFLRVYLERGDTLLAAYLLELAEEKGVAVPFPAALFWALYESRMAIRVQDHVNPRLTEALDQAVAVLADIEDTGDADKARLARRLVLSALLRPALFGAYDTARGWLRQMPLVGAEKQLARTLGDLGYDIRLSLDDLRTIRGNTQSDPLPGLTAQLAELMAANRHKKLNYQPASELLHRLFDSGSAFGRAFEAAASGEAGAVLLVEECVATLPSDRAEITIFISEQAAELLGRRQPIEGTSLRALCKLLEVAFDALRDWLDAARSAQSRIDNRRRNTLEATITQVRKSALEVLKELADDAGQDTPLDAAVTSALRGALQDLVDLCEGREPVLHATRLARLSGSDLLRLTGGAQPRHEDDQAYSEERRDQRDTLYACLLQPELHARTLAEAFPKRLADEATLAAHDILSLARRFPNAVEALDLADAEEQLDARIDALRKAHKAKIERLSSQLAMLWHLAGDHREQIAASMQRLSVIETALAANLSEDSDAVMIPAVNGLRSAAIPPDFPELVRVLEQVSALVQRRHQHIIEDQRRRLEELSRQERYRVPASALLARMTEFDPVTVDSMIGQIQDGLPFAAIEGRSPDTFARFHPDFVTAAAAQRENATRLVEAELQGKAMLGLSPCLRSPDQEKRALDLMRYWSSFTNAMKSGAGDQMRAHLMSLLGTLGFVGSRLENSAALIPRRLHRFTLAAKVRLGREQFLPPIYGSESRDLYNVLIADEAVRDRELVTHLGATGRDKPSFLIVLGRLDRRRRETLAHELRLERQTTVLLDESLMIYLALGEDEPLETLFACGLPFGYIQPYTTKPRTIPPEMFFGRKDEIQKIVARQSGGCLVYGGRQLGKSALLNHVKQLYDNAETGHRVINIDIKPVGGRGVPASRIWRDLADALHDANVFDVKDYTAESFRAEVRQWLRAKPGRQLLIMLDEADNFLASEARTGSYSNLHALKDLMETTNWDFKVVFAGLHNVHRMSRAANSPLPHLGKPICIGPLDGNDDNLAEARRLVTAPMRAAGYDYTDPNLAFSVLARVNYYPSLVQVFCQAVIENAGKLQRQSGSGPYWKLGRTELFEGAIWRSINDEIQTRFQVTLELDWRYEAIAKVIALFGSEGPEWNTRILRTGVSATDIHEMVMGFWPDGIEPLSRNDFQVLLEEMKDLGVLSSPAEGLYVLRNAQVAQLLGARSDLEQALLTAMEREEQVDYDPASFHSPYVAKETDESAPVTDAQLDSLLGDEPGQGKVAALVVHRELWHFADPKGLCDLIEMRSDRQRPLSVVVSSAEHRSIRTQIEAKFDQPNERRVLLIRGNWDPKVAEVLADNARVRQGGLRPVWSLPPEWLVQAHRRQELPDFLHVVCARPWSQAMLRHWLDSHGLTRLDQSKVREAILAVTGGLPALLRAILPNLQQQTTPSPEALTAAIGAWTVPTGRDAPRVDLASFGFNPAEVQRLRELAMEMLTSPGEMLVAASLTEPWQAALIPPAEALGLLYRRQDRFGLSPMGRLLMT